VPSPAAGTLVEILVEEGDTVEVGSVIARIGVGEGASAGGTAPTAPSQGAQSTAPAQADPPKTPDEAPSQPSYEPVGDGGSSITRTSKDGRFFSPLVRSIAETEGLSMEELSQVPGSGREGRVSKDDLMQYLQTRGQQPAPQQTQPAPAQPQAKPADRAPQPSAKPTQPPVPQASGYGDRVEVQEMDRMRRIIADHMVRSKATSPHVTSFAEIDVTNLVRQREKNKRRVQEREGVKLTFTPYFIRAAVDALRDHPLLNASVEGTRILIRKDFHIGMAVALGTTGLVAPVIRDAGSLNLVGLAKAAADLATRARDKKLQPDELSGGTFTVTNVGSLGSLMGTPIINQPQVAILSPGAIVKRPVVIEHPELGDTIAIRHMMYVSLSYDHRIIDGAMAASFLGAYRAQLEAIGPDSTLI
jgi:2-oxoglutarate dehydrogenase E2 component (dihydrolipoamide succinyltransferase)